MGERRDYLREAMDVMSDLSLSDLDAVKKAAALLEQSNASEINKAFTMAMSANIRGGMKRKREVGHG